MLNKTTVNFNNPSNILLFLCLLFFYSGTVFAGSVSGAVKTGFLFNFFKFVEWPEEVNDQNFRLCLVEEGELGASVASLNGKRVKGKSITVKRNVQGEAVKNCSMVFLPEDADSRKDLLKHLNGLPILTVGDGESFIDEGGMIGLIENGSHLGFEVNLSQLKNAKLQVSAQLLKLAKTVKGGS